MRLFSVSTLMSSKEISSALFGLGLPPVAPMSPPAQLTRIFTAPSFPSIVRFIAATAARSPILPSTAQTLPPCRAICLATASRSAASPYLAGPVQEMSWIATFAPSEASLSAIARPSPRPDPVTNAVLPLSSPVKLISCCSLQRAGSQAQRAHIGRAAADHRQFVIDERGVVACLPGRAVIRLLRQMVDARRRCASGQRLSALGRIAAPPFRRQPPHMPRLQRARLQHRRQLGVMGGEQIEHLSYRRRAIADGAAHQAITLVGELNPIVLQMHVAHMRRDARVEIHRRLDDREGVAGIDANTDAAGLLAEAGEFVGAEILMILDRQHAPLVGDDGAILLERSTHAR